MGAAAREGGPPGCGAVPPEHVLHLSIRRSEAGGRPAGTWTEPAMPTPEQAKVAAEVTAALLAQREMRGLEPRERAHVTFAAERRVLFDPKVTHHVEVPDNSMRGSHTEYWIETSAYDGDGMLQTVTVRRRFSEWRVFHKQLVAAVGAASAKSFPVSRQMTAAGAATKAARGAALEAYLEAATKQAGSTPAAVLCRFLGLSSADAATLGLSHLASSKSSAEPAQASPARLRQALPRPAGGSLRSTEGGSSITSSITSSIGVGDAGVGGPPPPEGGGGSRTAPPAAPSAPASSSGVTAAAPAVTPPQAVAARSSRDAANSAAEPDSLWSRQPLSSALQAWRWLAREAAAVRAAVEDFADVPPLVVLAGAVLWVLTRLDLLVILLFLWHCAKKFVRRLRGGSTAAKGGAGAGAADGGAAAACVPGTSEGTTAGAAGGAVCEEVDGGEGEGEARPGTSGLVDHAVELADSVAASVAASLAGGVAASLAESVSGQVRAGVAQAIEALELEQGALEVDVPAMLRAASGGHDSAAHVTADWAMSPLVGLPLGMYLLETIRAWLHATATQADGAAAAPPPLTPLGKPVYILWWGLAIDAARQSRSLIFAMSLVLAARTAEAAVEAQMERIRDTEVHRRRVWHYRLSMAQVLSRLACAVLPFQLSLTGGVLSSYLASFVAAAIIKEGALSSELAHWAKLSETIHREAREARLRRQAEERELAAAEEAAAADAAAGSDAAFEPIDPATLEPSDGEVAARRAGAFKSVHVGYDDGARLFSSLPAGSAPPALATPLIDIIERSLLCLPHELRNLATPIAQELFLAGTAASTNTLGSVRSGLRAVGAAASLVLSRALLEPSGRMRLWLGLKELVDQGEKQKSAQESGGQEQGSGALLTAFTRQTHAFELGLRGSMVLCNALREETKVPMSRLVRPEKHAGDPVVQLSTVRVGEKVRVRYPYKPTRKDAGEVDKEEGLFCAIITKIHGLPPGYTPPEEDLAPPPTPKTPAAADASAGPSTPAADAAAASGGEGGGGSAASPAAQSSTPTHRRTLSDKLRTSFKEALVKEKAKALERAKVKVDWSKVSVDIRYTDDIDLIAGDGITRAGFNLLDMIPEVGATWRLWIKGMTIDINVPDDDGEGGSSSKLPLPVSSVARRRAASKAADEKAAKAAKEAAKEAAEEAAKEAAEEAAEAAAEEAAEAAAASCGSTSSGALPRPAEGVTGGEAEGGKAEGGGSAEGDAPAPAEAEEKPLLDMAALPSGMKTIGVDWEEPDAKAVEKGVFGSLIFTVWLPVVYLKALLKTGRFWSDSVLLKLGRFSDVAIKFDSAKIHAVLKFSFEKDGVWLAIRSLKLDAQNIRIDAMSEHSKRWGVLLGTVSGIQWMLSGFLERSLLDIIERAVVENNQRVDIVLWKNVPLLSEIKERMKHYQTRAATKEGKVRNAAERIQLTWRGYRDARRARGRALFAKRRGAATPSPRITPAPDPAPSPRMEGFQDGLSAEMRESGLSETLDALLS